jgi:hypothetical protein
MATSFQRLLIATGDGENSTAHRQDRLNPQADPDVRRRRRPRRALDAHSAYCSRMTLRLDGESTVDRSTCEDCGAEFLLVKSFVLDAEDAYAIALTALHHHEGFEAWMDVIFGSFAGDASDDSRITFGCRVGPVEGNREPAATAVTAAVPYRHSPTFGHKLSRDEALTHPRLPEFWRVVDFLLVDEPVINHHVYAHLGPGGGAGSWWRRGRN